MGWGLPKLNVVSTLREISHDAQKGVGKLSDSGRTAIVNTVGTGYRVAAPVVKGVAKETTSAGKFFTGKGFDSLEFLTDKGFSAAEWAAGGAADTVKGTGSWLGGQASTLKWFPIIALAGAAVLLYSVRGEVGKTVRSVGLGR